jgi:hypothetical protein
MPQALLDYYRDARVVAFPAPHADSAPAAAHVAAVDHDRLGALSTALLSDQRLDSSVAMKEGDTLTFELDEPVAIRSVTINSALIGNIPRLRLESSPDGQGFATVGWLNSHGRHGIIAPVSVNFDTVRSRYFRLVALGEGTLGEVALNRTARIADWEFKSNLAYQVGKQVEIPSETGASEAIDPDRVVDITRSMDPAGRLRWQPPAGAWLILRLGYTTTAHLNVAASIAGTGLESDKLDPEATELSFDNTVGRVLDAVGPLAGKSFRHVEIDSYEAGMQNWTADFPEEFLERAGYDITPYLPVLTGRVVRDAAVSERFLFDFRSVQAGMMADYYYGRMGELVEAHDLDLYVEGYGQGMFDELEVSGRAEIPMTEFWVRTPWTPNRSVKVVASAANVYGKPVVAAESFTGEEQTSRWLGYPYAFKAEGDYMFSLGQNQILFHRYAHQPHATAVPGMAMGPWGIHFERTTTWFEHSKPWLDYLARSQHLLRQGHSVADVLYFTGERPPTLAQWIRPAMPPGYDYDHIDARALMERVTINDGDFVLPEGNRYRLLVLPDSLSAMTPELMRTLEDYIDEGASVMGPRPEYSLSLRGYPETETELRRMAERLWSPPADGSAGVFPVQPLERVLDDLGVAPDFSYTSANPDAAISWKHRKLRAGDLYFIGNRQRRVEQLLASFRVTGGAPQIWDAETGERMTAAVFAAEHGRTRVPLRLQPAGSLFVFIPHGRAADAPKSLRRGEEVLVSAEPIPASPLPQLSGTFTMAMWVKPDIDLREIPEESNEGRIDETGKFYAISAPEGDALFGNGHAAAGLAVGRNGIFVIERSSEQSPAVLVSRQPIAGWNHVAIVYRDGTPSLYVNGDWVKDGEVTGSIVHPAVGLPASPPDAVLHFAGLDGLARASGIPLPPTQGRVYNFEGNFDEPVVYAVALEESELRELAVKSSPGSVPAAAIELRGSEAGKIRAIAWESGRYGLDGAEAVDVIVAEPVAVEGPWEVRFQPDRGAPASIRMPELISLHRHEDDGVKYFSGEAQYNKVIEIPPAWLDEARRVVLDLGRVEVIAAVRVNGRMFPALWKEPYRVDITDVVHAGDNRLEIEVVNLWTNRLIGDEQLPAEVEFGFDSDQPGSPFYGKGVKAFPDWFLAGDAKPAGGRTTFTTWQFYDPDEPLVASGLLGPVRLYNPVSITFD